jgi:hypothetical protein
MHCCGELRQGTGTSKIDACDRACYKTGVYGPMVRPISCPITPTLTLPHRGGEVAVSGE